jgi:hypothetical protein
MFARCSTSCTSSSGRRGAQTGVSSRRPAPSTTGRHCHHDGVPLPACTTNLCRVVGSPRLTCTGSVVGLARMVPGLWAADVDGACGAGAGAAGVCVFSPYLQYINTPHPERAAPCLRRACSARSRVERLQTCCSVGVALHSHCACGSVLHSLPGGRVGPLTVIRSTHCDVPLCGSHCSHNARCFACTV